MDEVERLMDYTWLSVQDRVAKIATEVFRGTGCDSGDEVRDLEASKQAQEKELSVLENKLKIL